MTLNGPYVDVTVKNADTFSLSSKNSTLKQKDIMRFTKTLELIEQYLCISPQKISIEIDSHIPPAIGLASSSAVFCGFAKAVAELLILNGTCGTISDEQISIMARLGSGSAARSIFGGFGALKNIEGDAINSAIGFQVADEHHWKLYDIVIAPSLEEKKIGSTEGHANAGSSPHFEQRIHDINTKRFDECVSAIHVKDFEKLQVVAELDAMNMHHCMQTQNPPLQYLSATTYKILDELKLLRETEHLPVLFTMDGGPTVHLFCEEEAVERVKAFANAQEGCTIFETHIGKGVAMI